MSDQMDALSSRWQSTEHLIDNTVKSLETKASKLSEQHDILNDVTRQVKECEDILASHNALGTNAYDSKHMDRIKVTTVVDLGFYVLTNLYLGIKLFGCDVITAVCGITYVSMGPCYLCIRIYTSYIYLHMSMGLFGFFYIPICVCETMLLSRNYRLSHV